MPSPLNDSAFKYSLRNLFIFNIIAIFLLGLKLLPHIRARHDDCLDGIDHGKLCRVNEILTMMPNIGDHILDTVIFVYYETDWFLVGFFMCFLEIQIIFIMTILNGVNGIYSADSKSFSNSRGNPEMLGSAKVIKATGNQSQLAQDEQIIPKTSCVHVVLPSHLISKVSGENDITAHINTFIADCLYAFIDLKARPFDVTAVEFNGIIYELKIKHEETIEAPTTAVSETNSSETGGVELSESAAYVYPVSGGIHSSTPMPSTNGSLTETDGSVGSSEWSESTRSDEYDPNWRNSLTL